MSLQSYFNKQRQDYASSLSTSRSYWHLSALTYATLKALEKTLSYVKGKTLDAGAGHQNHKILVQDNCTEYISLDIASFAGKIDIVSDITDMNVISTESFDTVYCSQVLEHVSEPAAALREIHRVMKPDGHLILSVPHLSGLHDEPYDYYRYTPYGLRHLLNKTGFVVVEEYRAGGVLSFLSHPLSFALVLSFWAIPMVKWAAWYFNWFFIVLPAYGLDRCLRLQQKYPANLVVVAGKK